MNDQKSSNRKPYSTKCLKSSPLLQKSASPSLNYLRQHKKVSALVSHWEQQPFQQKVTAPPIAFIKPEVIKFESEEEEELKQDSDSSIEILDQEERAPSLNFDSKQTSLDDFDVQPEVLKEKEESILNHFQPKEFLQLSKSNWSKLQSETKELFLYDEKLPIHKNFHYQSVKHQTPSSKEFQLMSQMPLKAQISDNENNRTQKTFSLIEQQRQKPFIVLPNQRIKSVKSFLI